MGIGFFFSEYFCNVKINHERGRTDGEINDRSNNDDVVEWGNYTFRWGSDVWCRAQAALDEKYPCNDQNQIPLRTDPILLQVDGKNILIESGIGKGKLNEKQKRNFGVTEESDLENQLALLSLTPEDIDLVLMTHLHFDHASGLTNGKEIRSFPRFRVRALLHRQWNGRR